MDSGGWTEEERMIEHAYLQAEELEKLQKQNEALIKAMKGWGSYAWKNGEYIDDIQEYFDEVLKNVRS